MVPPAPRRVPRVALFVSHCRAVLSGVGDWVEEVCEDGQSLGALCSCCSCFEIATLLLDRSTVRLRRMIVCPETFSPLLRLWGFGHRQTPARPWLRCSALREGQELRSLPSRTSVGLDPQTVVLPPLLRVHSFVRHSVDSFFFFFLLLPATCIATLDLKSEVHATPPLIPCLSLTRTMLTFFVIPRQTGGSTCRSACSGGLSEVGGQGCRGTFLPPVIH